MIVDADEGATEGEDLTEGGQYCWVDDSCGWNDEGGDDEENAEDDKDHGEEYLEFMFHILDFFTQRRWV